MFDNVIKNLPWLCEYRQEIAKAEGGVDARRAQMWNSPTNEAEG
jgi:hypothetical protein